MSRLWAREFTSTAVIPLAAAAYCADCEALFDMRQQHQSCPACASRTIVPVSSLINKWSRLVRVESWIPSGASSAPSDDTEHPVSGRARPSRLVPENVSHS